MIKLKISEDDIKGAIRDALKENFNRRDNLRHRGANVQFDCLVRGYIGELGIKRWFGEHGIEFDETNYMSDEQGNIDIDLLYSYGENQQKTLEIKTSLVPDNYAKGVSDIEQRIVRCIDNFDIKLIRRFSETIEELKGDIHIQVYFGDLRRAKDTFLNAQTISLYEEITDEYIEHIYHTLKAQSYLNRTFFVGWIDRETLIEQIHAKSPNRQIWSMPQFKREFWTCKLRDEAKAPHELIDYIKALG